MVVLKSWGHQKIVVGRVNEVVVLLRGLQMRKIPSHVVRRGEMKSGRIIGVVVLTRWSYGGVLL